MVTITVDLQDLENLIGRPLPKDAEALNELLSYLKAECDTTFLEGALTLELKDTNRPDLWSPEGIARAIRGVLGIEVGLKRYGFAGASHLSVFVDRRLKPIRPYIACAVAKQMTLTDAAIRSFIQLQDKLDQSYGRKRRRASIGFYNLDLIKPPIYYTLADPDRLKFVPLDMDREMSLREILEKHPKGQLYGHIVGAFKRWPILIDSAKNVLSFPPIINSDDVGKVYTSTKNVFVEVTGTSHHVVMNTLKVITTALADRGAKIYPVSVRYPSRNMGLIRTPDLRTSRVAVPISYVKAILGVELPKKVMVTLLEKARYDAEARGASLAVDIPCYRLDIMHSVDVVEDVAIYYGLNRFEPRWPSFITFGATRPEESFMKAIRELFLGFGFQEVLTFMLISPDKLFKKMRLEPEPVIEVSNPKISTMTCLRTWLLPSLMEVLSHNTHVEYPQRIFEVGVCTQPDPKAYNRALDVWKLAGVLIHSRASYTEMKAIIDALMLNLRVDYEIVEVNHPSLIEGRAGELLAKGEKVGFMGEVHPEVLENWGLENPAVAVEIDLGKLISLL